MDLKYAAIPSKAAYSANHLYLADSIHATIQVYAIDAGLFQADNYQCSTDDTDLNTMDGDQKGYEPIKEELTFQLNLNKDQSHVAICGLAADLEGHIIVSEATSHTVQLQ